MTRLQQIQIRQSELRSKLKTQLDTPTEHRSETFQSDLDVTSKELNGLESEYRATLLVEGEPDVTTRATATPEGKELRSLIDKANIGHIFESALQMRSIDGPERELQQHFGLPFNSIPLELLETRAAATFGSGDEEGTARPVVPQLFPMSVAEFAGVSIEQVPFGQALYPVLTTGADAKTPAQGAASAETTGVFGITTLTPKRIQAGFSFQVEDAAVFSFMPDALRMNLSDALQAELDKQILVRSGDGLLDFGTDPSTPGAATTQAAYLAALFEAVDGLYANMASEVRMVVGSGANGAYQHMGATFRGNNSDDNLVTLWNNLSGGLRVSGHVPGYSSNHQEAVVIKGPPRRNCVAALWQGVQLIEDRITKAAEGEVKLTAIMLYDMAVLRESGYKRHRFRTS